MDFTTITVAGADALQRLQEYRASYAASGQYPFLIGDKRGLERHQEALEFNPEDPASIILEAEEFSLDDWFAEKRVETADYELSDQEILGAWPGDVQDKGSIGLHLDVLSRQVKPKVYLGLAELQEPWHLPAVMRFGNWNACPEPVVHCAIFRKWQDKYGAEITGMSGDVIECTVSRPPATQQQATELAWEQFWYCDDIVTQGVETVSNLAATLINSPYWYFWWD